MQLFTQPPRTSFQPTVIPDDVPVYRIKEGKFFVDDELLPEGAIVAFSEEPNLEMEPLNSLAVEALRAYMKKLDKLGRLKAEKEGKAYASYEDAFNNAMSLRGGEGRKAMLLNGIEQTPIMGGKQRGKKKASKIEIAKVSSEPVLAVGRQEVNDTSDMGL